MVEGAICGVPQRVLEVLETEREPERWCYGERKRRGGTWELVAPSMEWVHATLAYGWAEPYWRYRCDGCGRDRRHLW